jgi:hypothetical protein
MPKLDLSRVTLDKRGITRAQAQAQNYLKFSTSLDIQGIFQEKKRKKNLCGGISFYETTSTFAKERVCWITCPPNTLEFFASAIIRPF